MVAYYVNDASDVTAPHVILVFIPILLV